MSRINSGAQAAVLVESDSDHNFSDHDFTDHGFTEDSSLRSPSTNFEGSLQEFSELGNMDDDWSDFMEQFELPDLYDSDGDQSNGTTDSSLPEPFMSSSTGSPVNATSSSSTPASASASPSSPISQGSPQLAAMPPALNLDRPRELLLPPTLHLGRSSRQGHEAHLGSQRHTPLDLAQNTLPGPSQPRQRGGLHPFTQGATSLMRGGAQGSPRQEMFDGGQEQSGSRRDLFHQLRASRLAREARRGVPRPDQDDWGLGSGMSTPIVNLDDELIEMEIGTARSVPSSANHQTAPPPPLQQQRRQVQRNLNHSSHHNHSIHDSTQARQRDIIDLTAEPDSPVLVSAHPAAMPQARSQDNSQQPRNPRRQVSQNRRTPSLARSDGSILNGNAEVIDLTIDSPERVLPPPFGFSQLRSNQRDQANIGDDQNPLHNFGHQVRQHLPGFAGGFLASLRLTNHLFARMSGAQEELQLLGANVNPLANNPVEFNYQANGFGGFGRASPPKNDFTSPPPARDGFTRNTGEDVVAVCPGCDDELRYDPDDNADDNSRPAKRQRTKKSAKAIKDSEEHHFWAVKACGHVYCRDCYENRKKLSKANKDVPLVETNFRHVPGNRSVKTYCAVQGCKSEVSAPSNWVGIFL